MPENVRTQKPSAVHEFAQQGVKDGFEKTKAGAEETTKTVEQAYTSATKGATEFNAHLIEIARANTSAAFDFALQLARVKSPSEFFELSAAHARKQLETLTKQTQELSNIAQRVTTETVAPLQHGLTKAFNKNA